MPSQGLFEMDKLSLMRATPSPGPSISTDNGSTTLLPSGELRITASSEVKSVRSIDSGGARKFISRLNIIIVSLISFPYS